MAVSSPLNPGTIARERRTTAVAAQNFITGGAPLGEGVVASAANKIVGFQRGAAGVAARPPDLKGIIQTLSTSILNNVENRVQSVNQNVTQIVNKVISGLQKNYQERLDKIDASKPNSILQNFLNLYKQALGYIQFLGNRKNVKTLGDNLKELQNVFAETFNIAKIIRQTILNIVKQLSNLPTASTGGGGLNLDIDIPGGGLKKGGMSKISRMMRGKRGLMLGGAALAGGLGANVVSGMLDVGGDNIQAAPMSDGTIPGILLDRFSSILDRFAAAVASFSNAKRSQAAKPSGVSSGEQRQQQEDKNAPSPSSDISSGTAPGVSTKGEKGVLDLIASVESGPQGYDSYNVSRGKTKGKASEQTIGWLAKNAQGAIGRYQQMPEYLIERAKRAGFNENTKFTPEVQDAITLNELRTGHKMNEFLSGKISEDQFLQRVSATWRGLPQGQANAAKLGGTADLTYQDRYAGSNRAGKTYAQTISELKNIRSGGNAPVTVVAPTQTKPGVTAATTQAVTQQQIAQSVSRPPVQQAPQVTVAPMNVGSPQVQSSKNGTPISPPPAISKGGISVPFFTSSNHDNFLTLYSKLVYNIVDG